MCEFGYLLETASIEYQATDQFCVLQVKRSDNKRSTDLQAAWVGNQACCDQQFSEDFGGKLALFQP
ncbi:hypothetical protein D6T64_03905 [Cryobacterium melibiosiphilum]|uniref:Uncharacterized protein n=1 Tax=Cryobacterium melibiosiphilum TaxID=995039 RepID=A0A3A5MN87_9MICO|nr:hypothetical protein D6T64_03905 [Cryobacterium melibiosiphilum]